MRSTLRIVLSSYVANGVAVAAGLFVISALVHLFLGPAAAATATVGVIVVTPADRAGPIRGKFIHLLPAVLIGPPLFLAVQVLRGQPMALSLLLVVATFFAFLGAAWGKRGLPISVSVMFAMIFSLAQPLRDGPAAAWHATLDFTLGAVLYLLWGTATSALLNARYRVQFVAESLLAVSRLMRTQARQFHREGLATQGRFLGQLMGQQAALADQLQAARNVLLESPRSPKRLRLAGMLMQILDMRDHLVACSLDLDILRSDPAHDALLRSLGTQIEALAEQVQSLADALLLGRRPAPFQAPPDADLLSAQHDAADLAQAAEPSANLLARAVVNRVSYIGDEVRRLVELARGEREPDVAIVRRAWQLFVSPTGWSWRPFAALWHWDAPPLRHAIRAALAIAAGQTITLVLPWGTHDYWILLTIVVVLRGSLAQTLERRNSRVLGTLLGCVLTGMLLAAHPPAVLLLVIVTIAQGIAHAFAVSRYLVTAVAATILALVQAHLLSSDVATAFEVAERIGDTVIGVALAWLFSYILPSWERHQVPALIARTLAAHKQHVQQALALGQLTAVDNKAELAWRLARREVYDSLSALVQAVQRALAEPRAVQPRLDNLERVVGHSYQLLAQLTAVKTMLLQRRERLDAAQMRDPLKDAADEIAAVLDGRIPVQASTMAQDAGTTMLDLPDPSEQLTPWLLRRLQLASGIARDLRAEASQAGAG